MNVYINNTLHSLPDDAHTGMIPEALGVGLNGIAIAVNNEVVPKEQWPMTRLAEHDKVTVIKATQGG
jgi:sulfur carrier protein